MSSPIRAAATPPLAIATDKVCTIAMLAREFDAKAGTANPDPGSNPTDDDMHRVLEDVPGDPSERELVDYIASLNAEEQIDLVALAWLGRGDGTLDDWAELQATAADARNGRAADYLKGMPLLADYLEDGLSAFGRSCEDVELERQ